MNITYREGTIQDKDKLKDLGLTSYGQFKNELTADNWEKMNNFLSAEKSYTELLNTSKSFVCEVDKQIVGMAYLVAKGHPTDLFLHALNSYFSLIKPLLKNEDRP